MKVNKIFGVKSITNLIYGMLLLLPMVSILSRVIYTQANPNAKDSYSNHIINESLNLQDMGQFTEGQEYTISYKSDISTGSNPLPFTYISLTPTDLNSTQSEFDSLNRWWLNSSNNRLYFSNSNQSFITYINWSLGLEFNFIGNINSNYFDCAYINRIVLVNDTLDNVFEYSLNSFLQEYDTQSIDFFSWFTNLFLNRSNEHNALYLNFCNWYMNYVLLVSSAYLLFFALMWFINYIRKLLEKSSYHDFGGF